MKKKRRWSSAEDDILREYVKEHGEGNWHLIEKNSDLSRSGKSCWTEAGLRGLVFNLNLPLAEPSDRRFMVGYALLPKKQRSLIRPSLVSTTRDCGVYLVPVNQLYDGECKAQLADFAAKNPGVPIIDHPLAIERLHNHDRIAMLHQVSELNVPHGTETFGGPKPSVAP
ncbi:hypothetical protein ZIOFF_010261 [Zingiber officinale]|uniref:Uncharacterized protein n=1 Tax=Zingiber officinale TaxID=94328 RepID=A0A8J5HZF0_ZINOF|nr:hypothetical protein ZIOFF_010261 [Zingiber officinale]